MIERDGRHHETKSGGEHRSNRCQDGDNSTTSSTEKSEETDLYWGVTSTVFLEKMGAPFAPAFVLAPLRLSRGRLTTGFIPKPCRVRFALPKRPARSVLMGSKGVDPLRFAAGAAYTAYLPYIFVLAPCAPADPVPALQEAILLSVNFAFVTPTFLPALTSAVHPCFEGLFNLVVAWALLLIGFAAEDVPRGRQPVPYSAIAVSVAFLTNIFYLPYLILRSSDGAATVSELHRPVPSPSPFLRLAESRFLPASLLALALTSIGWACAARPEFGDLPTRLASFQTILHDNILAHSLGVDALAFSLFQSTLVADDVRRRAWSGRRCDVAVLAARFVPFFGLTYYLWERAHCASLLVQIEADAE